uniref:SERPIN domain-containing protein n=1 Tax=Echinostoma caproni TaxID=27848 RepID=A0A183B2L5_9TREM
LNAATQSREFWYAKGQSVMVPMMSGIHSLPFVRFSDKGFSLLEKPLKGDRFSLVFLLPKRKWDMKEVDKVLNGFYLLKDLVSQARTTGVSVILPRFTIDSQINLIPYMQSMGINDLFNRGQADLSGITDSEKLYVNMMKQASVLKVTEAGVEATAVTGVVVVPMSLVLPDVEFHADHPFVCFVYDRELQMPLFAARVTNPKKA